MKPFEETMSTISPPSTLQTPTVLSWYKRPSVWIATVALLLGAAYAVVMYMSCQEKETEQQALLQDIAKEKKATHAAGEELKAMPVPLAQLQQQREALQSSLDVMQKSLESEQKELDSLKQNEFIKEYLQKAPEIKALTQRTQELREKVESKLQEYQELVNKNRE